jgi:periplasmic divalent cation tolerance protein
LVIRLLLSTFASSEDAAAVIRKVVEEKLAACGTILPGARSIYVWQGEIEDTAEAMVFFKTTAEKLPALASRVRELHPYDTPEIVSLDPGHVSSKYAAWVEEQLK